MVIFLAGYLACAEPEIVEFDASAYTYSSVANLTEKERQRIWDEMHLAIIRMHAYMDEARKHSERIMHVEVQQACRAAVEGAIAGLSGRTPYSIVIGGCLGALSRIGGNAYHEFILTKNCVREAEIYAKIADKLQERLWRDE